MGSQNSVDLSNHFHLFHDRPSSVSFKHELSPISNKSEETAYRNINFKQTSITQSCEIDKMLTLKTMCWLKKSKNSIFFNYGDILESRFQLPTLLSYARCD